MKSARTFDVVVIGGGPAGLSAALMLGRCCRSVLVCDTGRPRNRPSREMHGYLGHDGIPPLHLLELGRAEIARYGVVFVRGEATDVRCRPSYEGEHKTEFEVTLDGDETVRCRKLLFATGVRDILPEIQGVEAFYGRSVHHCPYCDGWEHRDRRLVAFGQGSAAVGLALMLRSWSATVTACTNGEQLTSDEQKRLTKNGIDYRTELVVSATGEQDKLQQLTFASGPPLACDALFFSTDKVSRSSLPARLSCECSEDGLVTTHRKQCTSIPGVYIAGDADGDVQFVIVAAAEGAIAASAINRELQDEDRGETSG